jgi:hypothetical protein
LVVGQGGLAGKYAAVAYHDLQLLQLAKQQAQPSHLQKTVAMKAVRWLTLCGHQKQQQQQQE